MTTPVLTIDGPSGAGKGTISRLMAKQLGWHYLDSGSIYRSLAIALINNNIAADNVKQVVEVAANLNLQFECGDELKVKLENQDISDQLGTESTGSLASKIAAIPEVRAVLLQKQRDFQQSPGLVADGRDMGTVVFPEAEHKVFLTASAEERARRRYKQLIEKGIDANLAQITEDIQQRDLRDQQRSTAPLAMAKDALYIDSSEMTITAVIEIISQFNR
jgi:cytidylate kinase